MKTLLVLLCCLTITTSAFSQTGAAKAFEREGGELQSSLKCLNTKEYASFKAKEIAVMNKDSRFKEMATSFGELFANCNTTSAGKLVAVSYNFGTLGSMSTDYILVTSTTAKEIKMVMPKGRITKDIQYFQRPVIKSVKGNMVEVAADGFKSDDGNCCPSYEVTYQYKLVNDRLIPVKLIKAERSKEK